MVRRALPGGFTLIELVMVLVVLGVIVGFAYPRVNIIRFRMDAGARLTRATLQRAQRLAITRQYDVVVSFDLANNRMRLVEDANNNTRVDVGEHVEWRPLEEKARFAVPPVGVNGVVSAAIVGSQLKTVDGMSTVVFHRNGAASTDLEVFLSAGRSNNNDFREVSVAQATGRTEWSRYINSRWKAGSL
ncbi:MAG: prepilin-type N-terminal cleavage/methylation domain-containing protein [Chloroflexota bacterium]|nr:prepilin-type N-terminal cleavage/methylation domain-containing protein [Chloroflexota bacterium]